MEAEQAARESVKTKLHISLLGRLFSLLSDVGIILAVILSWQRNHSILWAILHGCLSWLYVIYYGLT